MGANSTSFQPGNPGGPGRKKGSRNKFSWDLVEEFYEQWELFGKAAIEHCRKRHPAVFVAVCADLVRRMPAQNIDVSDEQPGDEAIRAALAKMAR